MIRQNSTLELNRRFQFVGQGTWNNQGVQCWQEVTRRHKIAQPGQSAKGRDIGGGGDERMQDCDQGESEVDEGTEITSDNVEGMDLVSAEPALE